jgi:peptidoglycan/LPS O-acetylase OafA/YrhL
MSGIKLGFRFQLPASDRPGVLVQTSTTSSGLTLGYAGKSLVLSLPNDHSDPAGVAFGGDLAPDIWHDLTLRGEFGVNLTITLDNKVVHTGPFERPDFAANRLRLGSALDDTRHFEGQFIAPHLSVIRPRETAVSYFVYGRLILFGLMVYIILRMSQSAAAPSGARAPQPRGQIDYLLLVRALACGFVLFGHILLVAFPPRTLSSHMDLFYRFFAPCPWVGVWMFFTLSGYLMGKGFFSGRYHLDSSRIASFYRNRALRIVPLYCVAVLLVAALETPEIFHPNRLWNLADILSFGSNGDPIHPIGALWSVSTEVQFYLLVPLLVLLFFARPLRRLHLVIPLLAAIALLGMIARRLVLQSFGAQVWGSLIYSPVLGNLDIFAFGMILNPVCECFRGRISLSGVGKLVLFSMVGLAGYFLMINFTLRAMVRPEPADFFGMIGCGPTIAAAFTGGLIFIAEATVVDGGESRLLKIITAGGCQAGLLSYSIYVWHEPIIVGIRRWFPTTLSEYRSFVALIICLPVIGVAAAASYYLIERPFERLKWRARS